MIQAHLERISPASAVCTSSTSSVACVKGDETRAVAIEVPEIDSQEIMGEWLVPKDGILLVSFGPHTVADKDGKAVVRERLAIVEAEGIADGAVQRTSRVPGFVPSPRSVLPPATAAPRTIPAPVVAPKVPIAVPVPPSRSIPQGAHPDGTPAELPPLPADEIETPHPSQSAEPSPSPQSKKTQPPAKPASDSQTKKTGYQTTPTSTAIPGMFLARRTSVCSSSCRSSRSRSSFRSTADWRSKSSAGSSPTRNRSTVTRPTSSEAIRCRDEFNRPVPTILQRRGIAPVHRDRDPGDIIAGRAGEPDRRARHIGRLGPSTLRNPCKTALVKARDLLPGLFRQLGVEPARQDRVDLDPVRGPGECQALGQLDDPSFARCIRRREAGAEDRGHAADIHDLAAALPFHRRIDRLRHQERTGEVGVDDFVPFRERHLLRRPADVDAGIIEQDVGAAEPLQRLVGGSLDVIARETSAVTTSVSDPVWDWICWAAASDFAVFRPRTATLAPAWASPCAMPSPIPPLPPSRSPLCRSGRIVSLRSPFDMTGRKSARPCRPGSPCPSQFNPT